MILIAFREFQVWAIIIAALYAKVFERILRGFRIRGQARQVQRLIAVEAPLLACRGLAREQGEFDACAHAGVDGRVTVIPDDGRLDASGARSDELGDVAEVVEFRLNVNIREA